MAEKLKGLNTAALGSVIFIAVLSIPALFILGSAWAAKNLVHPLIVSGWFLLALDLFVLLPLSVFRGLRGFTGVPIFISSFVFGFITWLIGLILT